MAFTVVQAGTKLYFVSTSGTATELTLPADVTLSTSYRPRFAVLNRSVFLVNSPTVNLAIDADGSVRIMSPLPPASPPRLAVGSTTGYTGTRRVKVSHAIKSSDGVILAESALGPHSNSVTFADQSMGATNTPISTQADVNCRRIYTTTTGGTTYFHWFDLDDNTVTSWDDAISDAGLSLLAEVGGLGAPPGSAPGTRMELITSWKNRLWGRSASTDLVDHVFYCEDRKPWAWPDTNDLIIPPEGQDAEGVTAFIPRRDVLGVARRNAFFQIVPVRDGFNVVRVIEGKGLIAPDSVAVINDIGYGLGYDGVYRWGPEGFASISDEKVKAWFTTDTYFNRSRFQYAIGSYNVAQNSYELHLSASGSTDLDRWISYNLDNGQWYGPHKTGEFTPVSRILSRDANNNDVSYVGSSNGFLWTMNHATRTDGDSTAIDMDCKFIYHADSPAVEKNWLMPEVLGKAEVSGTATLTPTVGGLGASAGSAISVDLTLDRQKLPRLGRGRFLQLRYRQNTAGVDNRLYGIELPYEEIGKR